MPTGSLGTAYVDQGRLDEAMFEFRTAVGINAGDGHIHYNLGNILHPQGHLAEAIEEYQIALRIRPDDAANPQQSRPCLLYPGGFGEAIARILDRTPAQARLRGSSQ